MLRTLLFVKLLLQLLGVGDVSKVSVRLLEYGGKRIPHLGGKGAVVENMLYCFLLHC